MPVEETPVEETPVEEPAPQGSAPSRRQVIQDAANMGVLARQAIGNEFEDMIVDPRVCVNVAVLVEELTRTHDEAPAPEDTPTPMSNMLDVAREEGRLQAVAAFAQEKADLLQRITGLETSCQHLTGRLETVVAERDALNPPLIADAQGGLTRVSDPEGQRVTLDVESENPPAPVPPAHSAIGGPVETPASDFKGPGQTP